MRIDLALKHLCLAKSRSIVKGWCNRQLVTLNGEPARASSTIHTNDTITIQYPMRTLTIKLLAIPTKQLSKSAAPKYYTEIS
jgi:ribosomal 50S subunit-recycling heat shock protein